MSTDVWDRRRLLVGLALAAVALAGCGEKAEQPKRIRVSLILGETSEWYQGVARWKQLLEERTQGQCLVEIIPNASRSNHSQSQELQDVQRGLLEASLESTILLSTIDKRWAVFSYPWLFPSHAIANEICDGPLGQEMMRKLLDANVVGLAYGTNGFRQVTNNQRPIRTPEDLKGLKIRVPQGLPPELFEYFGASAHQMNFGDLFVALRTGDMHGQENPLSVIDAAKLHSVQSHLTLWDYVYDPVVLCVNRDFWYRLSGDEQKLLRDCAKEALASERKLVAEADKALPAQLAKAGMKIVRLTKEEREAFERKARGLRPHFEGLVGEGLLERFRRAVADAVDAARARAAREAEEARRQAEEEAEEARY